MTIHPQKIANVLKLGAQERCDYFVRKIADTQIVWGLNEDGWATGSVGDRIAIPFWPEREFALLCANGAWDRYQAMPIQLHDFLSKWLPGMERDDRLCAVFPVPDASGKNLEPIPLRQLIEDEVSQYE